MSETDTAFASFERKWLDAQPEQALVAVFLRPADRERARAFGSLIHELEQTAFGVREPQVAAAKLAWWQQELVAASKGTARHPITRKIFLDARARTLDAGRWAALVDGALARIETSAASTFNELFTTFATFYGPVAQVESALLCGASVSDEANARLWTISHLLGSIVSLEHEQDCPPFIPMALLARHGLSRADLSHASPARTALLGDYLDVLIGEIIAASGVAGAGSLGRRVRIRLDLELALKARRSADPLKYLTNNPYASRWRGLWVAWREARAMQAG